MKPVHKKEAATVSWRPTIAGSHYAASCGHYLATAAAMRVLDAGGNAVDAGVTAAIALTVLQPDVVSFAGVLPTLIYMKGENQVVSLEGLGYWPAGTDIARLKAEGGDSVPEGILRQIVPAAPATHVEALRRFGTITYEQAATPAFQLARDGFYLYPVLRDGIELHAAGIDRYKENASIFRPGGKTPPVGSRLKQENLSRTIGRMIEAERQAAGDRKAKLRAVHDCFYKGSIAEEIAAFHKKHRGFLTREDLAGFEVPVEKSISTTYSGIEVHACDVWCQGVVLLETLKALEGIDLRALGHNTPKVPACARAGARPRIRGSRGLRRRSEIHEGPHRTAAVDQLRHRTAGAHRFRTRPRPHAQPWRDRRCAAGRAWPPSCRARARHRPRQIRFTAASPTPTATSGPPRRRTPCTTRR